ncbi:uncharacterized protein PV06_10218 [Exophiala oligosperma]|uniref:Dienelactone hydrolase domain-containing protein n=1 Tax=Exophiala oligosperma TaxID=215243 RepID=A0A0D2BJK7_9EURO|nr:uncharacterized protein PV06_10218 [Exophiala oligosperma]KIW37572.1 hypothetical protein PV06_10218 [Exophiala oligosperma]
MTSEACCRIPAIVAKGYQPRGVYQTIAGLNTYVTGSTAEAKSGIVDIFDIFGFSTQTLLGADVLAARTNSVVLVPDFFDGEAVSHDWLPADTEEKKAWLSRFMSEKAAFPRNVDLLLRVTKESKTTFANVNSWATFGLCWGGKVAVLASGPESPFVASGQAHPGRMDKADAEKLTIPHIVLASKDEPADTVTAYTEIIKTNGVGGVVETYHTMWHGWMGARADLETKESREEYSRG